MLHVKTADIESKSVKESLNIVTITEIKQEIIEMSVTPVVALKVVTMFPSPSKGMAAERTMDKTAETIKKIKQTKSHFPFD